MTSDKKLSLRFADFDCEIIGYDDPLHVLRRLVELYAEIAGEGHAPALTGGPSAAELRARFEAKVAENAAELGVTARVDHGHIAISRSEEAESPEGVSPAVLAGMTPGLRAEFEEMRARFKSAEDAGPGETSGKSPAKPSPAAGPSAFPPESASAKSVAGPEGHRTDAQPNRPRARVVRRERAASRKPARSDADFNDNFLFADFPAPETPPLVLSKSQLVKPPHADARREGAERAPASSPNTGDARRSNLTGFDRLRDVVEAASPRLDPSSSGPRARSGQPSQIRVDEDQEPADRFAAFVRDAGAVSVAEQMEAAAAWLALVRRRASFSRQDVMALFSAIDRQAQLSLEAELKAFEMLQGKGALLRTPNGLYRLGDAVRLDYEARLRA